MTDPGQPPNGDAASRHGPGAEEFAAGPHRLASLTLVPKADEKQSTKDFKSDQEVRWCPGCGDYAILAAFQSFLPELEIPRENLVIDLRHRLLVPAAVLREQLRHALDPRAGARPSRPAWPRPGRTCRSG